MHSPIVVFTSYPGKGRLHDRRTVGGAAYTKRLLAALRAAAPDLEIEVIAEMLEGEGDGREEGILVTRAWRRGSLASVSRAALLALRRPAKTLLVSYELNMVGARLANLAFLLLLGFGRRILGKRILFVLHQVVDRFDGLELPRPRALALAAAKSLLYRLIALASSGSIVFEEPLRRIPSMKRAALVPFGADDPPPVDRVAARRRLGIEEDTFTLLFFGFLSPYKGLGRLLEILDRSEISRRLGGREVRLIVAGDANPHHAGNRRYLRSVESVKERAREQGALVAGFVEEEEIGLYYSAADLVLIPYLLFFSSSYALSLSISYQRPVLVSRPLERYFEGSDFREAARAAGLSPEDLVFDFTAEDLARKVEAVAADPEPHLRFVAAMKRARSWSRVGSRLLEVLESDGRTATNGDLRAP